jgi:hypothetical protein
MLTQAALRRLALLETVAARLAVGGAGDGTAAAQAASLLDSLHRALMQREADATPQGAALLVTP